MNLASRLLAPSHYGAFAIMLMVDRLGPCLGRCQGHPQSLTCFQAAEVSGCQAERCEGCRLCKLFLFDACWLGTTRVGLFLRLPEFSVPSGSQQPKRLQQPAQSMHPQPQPAAPQMPPSPVQSQQQQSQQQAATGAASGARTVAVAILTLYTLLLLQPTSREIGGAVHR